MGALEDAGVYFESPAHAEADLNTRTYRNSLEEKLYREGRKKVIDEQAAMVRDGASKLMKKVQKDAADHDEAAQMYLGAAQDLRRRMKNREITPKEARKEIAKLNMEAENLSILAESLPNDYAKALHDRDHPRDVLEFLYRKYPVGPMRFDF